MDRYGNYYYNQRSGLWRSLRDGDLEESNVWDVLNERNSDQSQPETNPPHHYASSHVPSAAMMVPKSSSGSGSTGGSSSVPRSIFTHQSAPVNIPNWSQVQKRLGRSESSKVPSKRRTWRDNEDDYDGDGGEEEEEEDDDDDDDGKKVVPPHEYIAMRLARSNISSFSVLEGVGRKLKGRDLSAVRNHVLIKTGFLESP